MRLTTLCYIEKDGCWLMMHRVKKAQDENAGKWIGIGGHLEENESPEECALREIREETGLEITGLRLRGLITFILPDWGNELTFLYTARTAGEVSADYAEGPEGILRWVPIAEVESLSLWEGDRVFLPLLNQRQDCFSLKLTYLSGGVLEQAALDGEEIEYAH
ncbi:MAG: 8-oxo-dGTP diphosphatase [Clostridia bacterium]|nr:8-oxo-dGTP diphosphatase [Clostridia bacterium]